MKSYVLIALLFVAALSGCQKNTFDMAQIPAGKGGTKYTIKPNLNGGTVEDSTSSDTTK